MSKVMTSAELIEVLKLFPDAVVSVSTVQYGEKNHYEAGYVRQSPQPVTGFECENGLIILNGGKEKTI